MKKSSSKKYNKDIFSGSTTALALGMIIVVLVIVSYFFINQMKQDTQAKVKGLMTQINTSQDFQASQDGDMRMQQFKDNFPVINRMDLKLTCQICAYSTKSSTPNICLNTSSSNGQPYAHCSSGAIAGETCAVCPAISITPMPPISITPSPLCTKIPPQCLPGSKLGIPCPAAPTGGWCPPTITTYPTPPNGCYYKPGICPMIACKINPDGTTSCPPCKPTLICLSGTPGVNNTCTTQQICPDLGQKFMCTAFGRCGGCKNTTVCN